MNVQLRLALISLVLLALALVAAAAPAPVVANAATSKAYITKALAAGRCWAVDTEVDKDGGLLTGAPEAPLMPGRYRLHVLLARAPLGDLYSNAIEVTINIGNAECVVNPLLYALPNEFIDVPVDFTVGAGHRDAGYTVRWRVSPEAKKLLKVAGPAAETGPGDEDDLGDNLVNRPPTAADGTIAIRNLAKLPYNLAVCGVHIERLSPVTLAVQTDKIIYKPGETGTATVTATNPGDTPITVTLNVELIAGVEGRNTIATPKIDLPAGSSKTWTGTFTTTGMRWGAEVRASAADSADGARAVFAVTNNLFEVAMLAAQSADLYLDWKKPGNADAHVQKWRDDGFTGCECFFWAPCDFGDFTPDIEDFFSGQTQYTNSRAGTKALLDALHARGMVGTVYSNLWGTDGWSGFEILRKHPEWFQPGVQYASDHMEFWRLMEEKKVTTMHQWCETSLIQDPKITPGAIDLHANELIASHRQFGWDAVRYDSYYSTAWTKWATRKTRDQVNAVAPGFQFGYNTFPGSDAKAGALDAMYDGGGMAMLEYIRQDTYPRLCDYAGQLLYCRDIVWPSGGQIGPLYHPPAPQDTKTTTATDIDAIYVSAAILATGGHPYYHPLEHAVGRFNRFALRYSEYLWNNRMRTLKNPAAVVSFGNGAKPFMWEALAQTGTLDGQRRRLTLHLLNADPNYKLFTNLTQKIPPPMRNLPITLNLPAGAQVTGAWNLCPTPDARHEGLPVQTSGGAVTFTVPEVRFWNVIVVEYSSPQPLDEKPTMREIAATCIQEWHVAGPFPNPGEKCEGFDAVYPPEKGVDLTATYVGMNNAKVAWRRTRTAGELPLGPGAIDFIKYFPPGNNMCAYAYTTITVDRDRDVMLLAGSDDTLQIWLNGAPVHANRAFRAADLDSDRVPVTLKKGVNSLLVKVCSGWGGWEFVLRVTDKTGLPLLDGVQYGFEK